MILKGNEASNFFNKINPADNEKECQLIIAKITGNFKKRNKRKRNNNKH